MCGGVYTTKLACPVLHSMTFCGQILLATCVLRRIMPVMWLYLHICKPQKWHVLLCILWLFCGQILLAPCIFRWTIMPVIWLCRHMCTTIGKAKSCRTYFNRVQKKIYATNVGKVTSRIVPLMWEKSHGASNVIILAILSFRCFEFWHSLKQAVSCHLGGKGHTVPEMW